VGVNDNQALFSSLCVLEHRLNGSKD
jgi:hypothetical protein